MKRSLLLELIDVKQKKNLSDAVIFYVFYLLISFVLMGFLSLFGIISGNVATRDAFEMVYSITRIISPIMIILISFYICYKKNSLDQISVILLILLSAFSSLFFLTITGLIVPAYLTTK